MSRRRGFTLVELLVVLGAITLLMALLFPALVKAREAGRRAKCLSNMRQTGQALMNYLVVNHNRPPVQYELVQDFLQDDVIANRPSILGMLKPYLGPSIEVYTCPSAVDGPDTFDGVPPEYGRTSYLCSGVVFYPLRVITDIGRTSEVVAMQEDRFVRRTATLAPIAHGTLAIYERWHWREDEDEQFTNLHNGGGNLLFADGHAEWRVYKDLRARDFALEGGEGVDGDAADDWTSPNGRAYRRAIVH